MNVVCLYAKVYGVPPKDYVTIFFKGPRGGVRAVVDMSPTEAHKLAEEITRKVPRP